MINKILNITKIVVIISLLVSLTRPNITTIFLLLFTITLLFLADYLKKKLSYPYKLQVIIYIFILGTELLGEINNYYNETKYFDDIMHTLSSFITSFLAVYILKKLTKTNTKKLTIIFALTMSMSISSLWEITEFTIDRIFSTDMQKDTIITTINSSIISIDKSTPQKKEITSLYVNNIDYIETYGGYIDIGLYDTMEDMICALLGVLIFIIIYLIPK